MVIDNWTKQTPGEAYFGMGSTEVKASLDMIAGREYHLTLEYSKSQTLQLAAVHLGGLSPMPTDAIERAAALATRSDVALIFAGLSGEWESEGFDRPDIDLVGRQNELIERVAAANRNTVVVLNTGSPVAMPWLDQVAEVVQVSVRDITSRLHRPNKELKAFAKVYLEPGESKTVTLTLARDALAYYDDLVHAWVAEAGEFEVLVGSSSQEIRATATFTLTATSHFGGSLEKEKVRL